MQNASLSPSPAEHPSGVSSPSLKAGGSSAELSTRHHVPNCALPTWPGLPRGPKHARHPAQGGQQQHIRHMPHQRQGSRQRGGVGRLGIQSRMKGLKAAHPLHGKVVLAHVRLVEHQQHGQARFVQNAACLVQQWRTWVSLGAQLR